MPTASGGTAVNVPSLSFLAFAAVGAALYHVSSRLAWRQGVLLVINLGFFAIFSHGSLLGAVPFIAFLVLGYLALCGAVVRTAGWLVVGAILLAFFWLKKYAFIPGQALLSFPYVTIGLSYVFFRVLHLAIDAREGALALRPGVVSYLNYTLNFTSLVSGPIQRYEDYRLVETQPPSVGLTVLGSSVERIALGMFKVFVVSAPLLALQRQALVGLIQGGSLAERLTGCMAVLSIYPVYLYLNFPDTPTSSSVWRTVTA